MSSASEAPVEGAFVVFGDGVNSTVDDLSLEDALTITGRVFIRDLTDNALLRIEQYRLDRIAYDSAIDAALAQGERFNQQTAPIRENPDHQNYERAAAWSAIAWAPLHKANADASALEHTAVPYLIRLLAALGTTPMPDDARRTLILLIVLGIQHDTRNIKHSTRRLSALAGGALTRTQIARGLKWLIAHHWARITNGEELTANRRYTKARSYRLYLPRRVTPPADPCDVTHAAATTIRWWWLDSIDVKIVGLLTERALIQRETYSTEVAEEIGLSPSSARRRLNRLLANNAVIDWGRRCNARLWAAGTGTVGPTIKPTTWIEAVATKGFEPNPEHHFNRWHVTHLERHVDPVTGEIRRGLWFASADDALSAMNPDDRFPTGTVKKSRSNSGLTITVEYWDQPAPVKKHRPRRNKVSGRWWSDPYWEYPDPERRLTTQVLAVFVEGARDRADGLFHPGVLMSNDRFFPLGQPVVIDEDPPWDPHPSPDEPF